MDVRIPLEKRKINALNKDQLKLEARLEATDTLALEIGGRLTDDEARKLVLEKLHDIASAELERYLVLERRRTIEAVENLWDKYAVSTRELEEARDGSLATLRSFLTGLGYE